MKRALLVLAILLMAATSYNQTSRRTTNANGSATRTTGQNNGTNNSSSRTSVNTNTNNSRVSESRENTNNNSNATRSQNSDNNRKVENIHSDNGNHYGQVKNHNNDNRSNNEYHHSDNRYTGNTVYVNQTSSRKYQHNHAANHSYKKAPYDRDYRATHYIYREPAHIDIYWSREMHRHYIDMYPEVRYWHYNVGYRINSVSAYYADFYIGEVMNVYGEVTDAFYASETDEYFLYFGAYYPYHDFTVIIPGEIARNYSNRPLIYFMNQYINVTGLITVFDGKPEIVVKRNFQIDVY